MKKTAILIEGIDFILDPMRQHIKAELFEHIDGIQTRTPNPDKKGNLMTKR